MKILVLGDDGYCACHGRCARVAAPDRANGNSVTDNIQARIDVGDNNYHNLSHRKCPEGLKRCW